VQQAIDRLYIVIYGRTADSLGDTYVFSQGDVGASVNDVLVKLVGVAGVTHLAENGATDQFFVV
jgi:hypothetical protein